MDPKPGWDMRKDSAKGTDSGKGTGGATESPTRLRPASSFGTSTGTTKDSSTRITAKNVPKQAEGGMLETATANRSARQPGYPPGGVAGALTLEQERVLLEHLPV